MEGREGEESAPLDLNPGDATAHGAAVNRFITKLAKHNSSILKHHFTPVLFCSTGCPVPKHSSSSGTNDCPPDGMAS